MDQIDVTKTCAQEVEEVLKKHNCEIVVDFRKDHVLQSSVLVYAPVIVQKQKDK